MKQFEPVLVEAESVVMSSEEEILRKQMIDIEVVKPVLVEAEEDDRAKVSAEVESVNADMLQRLSQMTAKRPNSNMVGRVSKKMKKSAGRKQIQKASRKRSR